MDLQEVKKAYPDFSEVGYGGAFVKGYLEGKRGFAPQTFDVWYIQLGYDRGWVQGQIAWMGENN